jgi:hypothetical protein
MQFLGNAKLSFTLRIRISHGNLKPSTRPWLKAVVYLPVGIRLDFQEDGLLKAGKSRSAAAIPPSVFDPYWTGACA